MRPPTTIRAWRLVQQQSSCRLPTRLRHRDHGALTEPPTTYKAGSSLCISRGRLKILRSAACYAASLPLKGADRCKAAGGGFLPSTPRPCCGVPCATAKPRPCPPGCLRISPRRRPYLFIRNMRNIRVYTPHQSSTYSTGHRRYLAAWGMTRAKYNGASPGSPSALAKDPA